MKTKLTKLAVLILMSQPIYAQSGGGLSPSEPPADGLMKTLDEVEARTAIASLPYTISAAGSYYLTASLTSATDGITISASNVTLDLNGFTLIGSGLSSSYEGVKAEGTSSNSLSNIKVTNGSVDGFGNSVELLYVNNSSLSNLSLANAGGNGIKLDGSGGGQCNNNSISHCSIYKPTTSGINLNGNSGSCEGNSMRKCTILEPNLYGVFLAGCSGNSLRECSILETGNSGVVLNGSTSKAEGNLVTKCSIVKTAGNGIYLLNTDNNVISDNVINATENHGVYLSSSDGNKVESNHVSTVNAVSVLTAFGIRTNSGANNIIIKNSSVGVTDNFSLSSNDTSGPEVSTTGPLSTTGVDVHPWANFSIN